MSKTIQTIDDLQPDLHNANKGTERGQYMVEHSLSQYGAGRSILADKEGRVIAGNKTLQAAADLGLGVRVVKTDGRELVVVQREDLDLTDGDRARLLAYADNRASEVGLEWDAEEVLADVTAGLDLSGLFQDFELQEIAGDLPGEEPSEDVAPQVDRAEELREKWGVESGQLWSIGNHRLLCGDSTKDTNVLGELPDNLIYDPPWDAELNTGVFMGDWRGVIGFCDGYRARDTIELFGLPAWVFFWDGMNCWYTPNRPLRRGKIALWFGDLDDYNFNGAHYGEPNEPYNVSNSRGSYRFEPDPRGKHLADVYQQSLTKLHSDGDHKHEKPLDWVRLLVGNCLCGDVYDPFIGSGVTMVACEQLGRRCLGVEIEPMNVALTLQRLCDLGLEPRLENMQQGLS